MTSLPKLTKAQSLKLLEGFNHEVQFGDGQYKFRNGSTAMEGSDIARRHSLRHSLEHGKPAELSVKTLDDIQEIRLMGQQDDAWFTKQAGL